MRANGIVAVEPQAAGEMITGPERNTDERGVALERNVGDGRQRAVPPGYAQNVGRRGSRQLSRVLSCLQDVGLDAGGLRRGGEPVCSRRARAGTGIDEEEGGQGWPD